MIYTDRLSPFAIHAQILGHDIGIRWYGLAYLFGFFLMYVFFRRAALRDEISGMTMEDVDNLAIRIVAGVMIGGRLGFVIQQPSRLLHDPLFLIAIWEGGMAYFGGLAGVLIACWTFARKRHLHFLSLTDLLSLPTCLALGVGRIANFINGELWGKRTFSDWGVVFPRIDNYPRHPSQLYECVSHLLLFLILYVVYKQWRGKYKPGGTSFIYLTGYGLFRVITDFWRQDDVYWGFFSDGQWFSLGIGLAGIIAFCIWWKHRNERREA